MKPRIAIPVPHGGDPEYGLRALPQYEQAVAASGGEPVRIRLDQGPDEVLQLVRGCHGVLLPGSKADVDPAKFGAVRHPKTQAADAQRDLVDQLLLNDAYGGRKPLLGICYGLQILNVHRSGTLVQHIESAINHEAGREIAVAHDVEVEPGSKLAAILSPEYGAAGAFAEPGSGREPRKRAPRLIVPTNSSHHQSAELVGTGLKIVGRCPQDGVIEAIEGTADGHFILAVQWHPERSFADDGYSRAIFRALVEAAKAYSESPRRP